MVTPGAGRPLRHPLATPLSLLVDWKQTRGKKEKRIEEKNFAVVAKFSLRHAYSFDLIGHILSASEPRRKECTPIGQIGMFEKIEPCRKKDKTVSFQSSNKASMV